ncbi:MAG: DUF4340 domain-containing protein [Gammaproteobacteria bacterium]|nr:DUF4340 domain-containing protein [Gammaproteobacteria bacterium]
MNQRNLLNIGLLALIGLLLLLVLYEPGIEKPAELPPLLSLDKGAIRQIAIRRDGQQDIELRLEEDGQWWMVQPLRHAADPFRIDSLLRISTIKFLTHFGASPDKLAAYQLESPRVTLTLNGATTIAFGGSTPLDQRRYVLVNGQVHLISDTLYYHLIGSFPTFLRKQLLDEGVSIEAITLPELNVAWQEGGWRLEPRPKGFSADQVTRLIDNWKLASALEIRPYDGSEGKVVSIKISGHERPIEFLLTAQEPDLILAHPEKGVQYHFDSSSVNNLLQLPNMGAAAGEPETLDNGDPHNH